MWDFFETVRHRHSVRKFQSDMTVEPEKLSAILEMACAAPSAGDLQSYHISVVTSEEARQQLSVAAGNQSFIAEAPVALVICSDPLRAASKYSDRGRDLYSVQDATIAATYAQLATVAAGLASTWVGYFDDNEVKRVAKIAPEFTPIAILSIGYPAELPEPTPRRHLDEVVTRL